MAIVNPSVYSMLVQVACSTFTSKSRHGTCLQLGCEGEAKEEGDSSYLEQIYTLSLSHRMVVLSLVPRPLPKYTVCACAKLSYGIRITPYLTVVYIRRLFVNVRFIAWVWLYG